MLLLRKVCASLNILNHSAGPLLRSDWHSPSWRLPATVKVQEFMVYCDRLARYILRLQGSLFWDPRVGLNLMSRNSEVT